MTARHQVRGIPGVSEATFNDALAGKVDKGSMVIDPRDYGAIGDGTADDTAAVLAAFTAANAAARAGVVGTILHPGATVVLMGRYKLTSLAAAIPIRCNVVANGAEFIVPAAYAGTAVLVGHSTSGSILQAAQISLPDVIKATGTSPVAGSVGVVVQNLYNSELVLGRTGYFETGVHFTGLGNGTVYNRIHLGLVFYCKVSVKLKPLTGGWVNQNTFVGGGIQQSAGFFGGTRLAGYRHLELDGAGINGVDGNSFYGVSFEGDVSEHCFWVRHAFNNQWDGCRFEAGTAFTSVTVSGANLTATGHGLVVGDMIIPTFTTTLPGGMAAVTPYYVVTVTDANTFSISRDKGGAPITFTSAGSGVIYARPHRIYFDTSGSGVSGNTISHPVNPLGWLDVVHSSGIVASNTIETPAYRTANQFAPEDLPFYRARNAASTAAVVRPLFAAYAPTVDPFEKPSSWATALSDRGILFGGSAGQVWAPGASATPEGAVTAPAGSLYTSTAGGVGKTAHVKESGSGNTGWAPLVTASGYGLERVFVLNFGTSANEKADIYFTGTQWTAFEVTVVGLFNGANASGVMRATYSLAGSSTGTVHQSSMQYDTVQGFVGDHFALMPAVWDATNSRWKITVAHRTTTTNNVTVRVRWISQATTYSNNVRDSIGVSAVYTTDTTVPPVPLTTLINVRDYGATGDGATDDTAAIQAAIAATTPGARVYYPPGTYIVSALLAPKAGTTQYGVRGKSILKVKAGVTGFNVFQPAGTSNVAFEDLVIDLNKANTTNPNSNTLGVGIYMAPTAGGVGFAVRRVEVMNGHQIGIRFLGHTGQTNPATLNASELVVEDCYVHDCSAQGIMAVNTTRLRIVNTTASANGIDGIFHSTSRNTVITGCTAEGNAGHGIVATYAEAMKITDNHCRANTGGWGIAVGGGSTTIQVNKRYVIKGNTCGANGLGGITNDPTVTGLPGTPQDVAGALIANNVCHDSVANHGIYAHNTKHVVITGNTCYGNPNSGIAVHGQRGIISDNLCYSNGSYGINIQADGTETSTYGQHKLSGNIAYSNTTRDIFVSSSASGVVLGDGLVVNVKDYGAAGDNTGNDAAAIQAAIDSLPTSGTFVGGTVYFPRGIYRLTAPITLKPGVHLVGEGQRASRVNSASGAGVFTWSANLSDVVVENLYLSGAAGHIFAATGDFGLYTTTVRNCMIVQNDTTKSIMHHVGATDYDNVQFLECNLQRAAGATVPAFNLVNSGGALNENRWENCWAHSNGSSNAPFFWIESTSTDNYAYNNVFRQITGEQNTGGLIHLFNNFGPVIDSVTDYDASTYTADLFKIGSSASAPLLRSRYVTISNSGRRGGTLGAGVYDINLVPAASSRCTVFSPNHSSEPSSGLRINFSETDSHTLLGVPPQGTVWPTQPADVAHFFGSGAKFGRAVHIGNNTEPATPAAGGVLYVEAGALKYKGSSGTITTLGPA